MKAKLAKDVSVDSATNTSVNSTNGVVTLSGMVDSPQTKAKAEDAAKSIPNVARVVDVLQVTPSAH